MEFNKHLNVSEQFGPNGISFPPPLKIQTLTTSQWPTRRREVWKRINTTIQKVSEDIQQILALIDPGQLHQAIINGLGSFTLEQMEKREA